MSAQALLGRVPAMAPAHLPAHARYSIRGRVYPGMVLSADGSGGVAGLLVTGLSPLEWHVLDEARIAAFYLA